MEDEKNESGQGHTLWWTLKSKYFCIKDGLIEISIRRMEKRCFFFFFNKGLVDDFQEILTLL